jgi:hypothetical protein
MKANPDQLDFGRHLMIPRELDDMVIDAALHHVENQAVLRAVLDGKPWGQAFGNGGSSHPVMWQSDARGIEVFWATDSARLIKPAQILERAKLYQPRVERPF